MKISVFLVALLLASPMSAWADILVAKQTISAGSLLHSENVEKRPGTGNEFVQSLFDAQDFQTNTIIYSGQPIEWRNLSKKHVVSRGSPVSIHFESGLFSLETIGNAITDGAIGDRISVINADTKRIIQVLVIGPNKVQVPPRTKDW